MKHDIDRLMGERNLDWIVVEGPDGFASANPDFNYLTGGVQLTGTVLKQRGQPAMIVYRTMERQQAEETGLVMVARDRWSMREIWQQCKDNFAAEVEHRRRMFADLGIRGRVGIYGTVKAGPHFAMLATLAQRLPDLEIVAEFENDLLSVARLTKDPAEIERMRLVGQKTCAVVQAVVDFIRTGRADGDTLVDASGRPIKIGDVRQLIGREIAARGLETPSGTIFAQGRDAGMPHAEGDDAAPLRLGQSIVFDIYPREQGGGYYHDMTRTFAIGYAPPELQQVYDHVRGAFEQVVSELEAGAPTRVYQELVCRYFEERGHPTINSSDALEEGYIHGLGHGLGLDIHEDLRITTVQDRGDVLVPGSVFTIEPGLYYPSRGYGVRIEDTFYCTPDGQVESLTPFPIDLVIPLG
ncbi:MAG: aminopeptidase P family protein [Kouleothrix sp.]|nr:aminopeptidase P family protein [Kouleothrix sp.]